ncbi:MAG TPA: cob(I)yrinic acid a,c-diamide adenosyltransferase, partial [Polyangiaceae bacterium]|nr:cob(I)yrinic acid a,c-diamide adenosyltransferase [Polyangiaceae bacterium]
GGQRVRKDDPRIVAYGTVDELNAFVGAARQTLGEHAAQTPALAALGEVLLRVQHELFNLGSVLATRPEDLRPQQARIGAHDITALEADMDQRNEELAALRSFVLPGGCRANTDLHVARTVCRRAERACVALAAVEAVDPQAIAYLNRLSDAFFVWSRWVSAKLGCEETLWDPNVAASAKDSPPAPSRDR